MTASRIKAGSLTGSDINLATLGKVPAATNADHAGTAGSAAIAQLTHVTSTVTLPLDNAYRDVSASCPAGTFVVGGGGRVADTNSYLNDSGPSGRPGWVSSVFSQSSATNGGVTITAICAPAASTAP